ncbi:cadherin domain-containing protein [Planctomycetes bacterium K23_9]|uniref:Cadherin domain protein n=1 Tax=Stieleria marina TaxID=1930275 RepID=A0A517NY99_9BACT|nr:Cadherin domain protein [Planctomycetes bacterium K23_9]
MTLSNSVRGVKRNRLGKRRGSQRELKRRRSLRRSFEQLESRQLLASLAGEVWADANSDGVHDASEVAVIDARVYIDSNDDRQFNANERFTRTDSLGQYTLDRLAAGSHVVRVDFMPGQAQTSPLAFNGTAIDPSGDGSQTRLFQMGPDGGVTLVGLPSDQSIDGLVENNAGELIGLDSQTDTIYRVDKSSGDALQLAVASVDLQGGLAYDAQSDTIYATAKVDGSLQLMTVDQASGLVAEPELVVSDVRTTNFGSNFYDFNLASQTAAAIPRNGGLFSSTLDQRSDGAIFGLQGNSLIEFAVTSAGSSGQQVAILSQSIAAISFGANDQLFGVSSVPSTLHQIDAANGNVTGSVAITHNGSPISGVAGFDIAADGTHYLVDSTHLYTFDPATGVATQAPNQALPASSPIFSSLSVAANGVLYATLFSTTTPVASIDPVTGIATPLGNSPLGAPYSAIVAGDSFATAAPLLGANASDLTFDPVAQRIVGFDDANDRFFQFDTQGRGTTLATSERGLNSSSLAFDGSRFLMFDADDATGQTVLQVDPDTGQIQTHLQTSSGLATQTLGLSDRSTAFRVAVSTSDDITGLDFGLAGVVNRPALGTGMFINELVIAPEFESRDTHQAIELRGEPNSTIPANTYFVLVKENQSIAGDQFETGHVQGVFDLSNLTFGANGFLVMLPQGSPYSVHPQSTVLQSNATGFSGLPGDIYTDDDPNSGTISKAIGSTGYFLVQSDIPPVVGADVDTDDDGFADPGGVMDDWMVHDSIALHPFVGRGDQTYADIVFVDQGTGNVGELTRREGVPQVIREATDYAGRLGDSIGRTEADWIIGTAIDVAAAGDPFQLGLDDGLFGVPIPEPFKARLLDHFGESNFIGGVRGTVRLAPLVDGDAVVDPAANVTVLADTNGNGLRDVISYRLEPDDYQVNADLTHVTPGVTVSTIQPGFNPPTGSTGFKIRPVAESPLNPLGNKLFSHEGVNFFNQDARHFRASFYRPARSVSIVGIAPRNNTLQSLTRLDAYNADGVLLGSVTSQILSGTASEVLSLEFSDDSIAYAEAYSVTEAVVINGATFSGSAFGRLDDFRYTQSEAITSTNLFGEYELTNLFPGNYEINFLNSTSNRELSGAQKVPLRVVRHENYILSPNSVPVTSDIDIAVLENTPTGVSVGQVVGSDSDGQVSYSLASGQAFGFQIDSASGVLTVGPGTVLDFENQSQFSFTVAVSDRVGAVTNATVNVDVLDINEPPVIEPTAVNVSEAAASGTDVGRIRATDPDTQPNDRLLSYSIDGGTGASIFTIDPDTGILTLSNPDGVNYEQTQELTLDVTVTDNGATPQSTSQTQVVKILDANDAPQLSLPDLSIVENSTGIVGIIGLSDEDANQEHLFQIDGGSGDAVFELRPGGRIAVRNDVELDFESQSEFLLNVTVVDNGAPAMTANGVLRLLITDVNEPAALQINTASVGENAVAGDVATTINMVDAENAIANYTVTLLDELDGGAFELRAVASADPLQKKFELVVADGAAFDFETQSTLRVVFQVDDQTGGSESARYERVIAVRNENDAPSVLTTRINVSESAQPGVENPLARLRFADVDPGESFTATIVGGTGADKFLLDPTTHVLTLAPGSVLDADVADPTLTLEVQVTDSGGKSAIGTVLVRLNNVNEPPIFSDTLGTVSVDSGAVYRKVFDDSFVSDPEGGDFQISVFDSSATLPKWIKYDPASRTLSVLPDPSFVGDHQFTVRAFELGSSDVNDLVFTIRVNPGDRPLTNQRDRLDVDNNLSIAPSDILAVINFLAEYGESTVSSDRPFAGFVDVSGNGVVTPLDIFLVIEGLSAQNARRGQGEQISVNDSLSFLDSDREDFVDEVFADIGEVSLF